jgi:hypothetical protein
MTSFSVSCGCCPLPEWGGRRLLPAANVIKLFTSVSYAFSQ